MFLLDSNIFIEAKNGYYSFEVCPGFWDAIVYHHNSGSLESIVPVQEELKSGNDDLVTWVKEQTDLFAPIDDATVLSAYGDMQTWAQNTNYLPEAKSEFADTSNADPWLLAYAKAYNRILVTHEAFNLATKKRILLPNVCSAFGIEWIDPFEMLRRLNVKFTWGGS